MDGRNHFVSPHGYALFGDIFDHKRDRSNSLAAASRNSNQLPATVTRPVSLGSKKIDRLRIHSSQSSREEKSGPPESSADSLFLAFMRKHGMIGTKQNIDVMRTERSMATATPLNNNTRTSRRARAYDNYFFSGMALLMLATVFIGFARTYFLAGVFRAPLPNLLIHIHGAVFSSWILLLIAQTMLVSIHRLDIHRKLGFYGSGLACVMVVLGELAAIDMLARRAAPPGSGLDPRTFYTIPFFGILIFGAVYFACRERSNSPAHKRLILIATIAIMDAPTGRPPFTAITAHRHMESVFVYAFLLLVIAYDLWSVRKVHRATIWASVFAVIALAVRIPIGSTGSWLAFDGWVQHVARSL
jgi:hypothetical protein